MSRAPFSPQLQKLSAISSLIGVHTVGGCTSPILAPAPPFMSSWLDKKPK